MSAKQIGTGTTILSNCILLLENDNKKRTNCPLNSERKTNGFPSVTTKIRRGKEEQNCYTTFLFDFPQTQLSEEKKIDRYSDIVKLYFKLDKKKDREKRREKQRDKLYKIRSDREDKERCRKGK